VTSNTGKIRSLFSTVAVFALLILAVFVMEISLKELLSPLLSGLNPFPAAGLHAAVMTVFYAVLFWFFFVQPLFCGENGKETYCRASVLFMFKAMAIIFLAEFTVVATFSHLLPALDDDKKTLFDAALDILICTPLLWWLLIRPATRSHGVHIADVLESPVKLYILLLFVVFMGDFTESLLLPFLTPLQDNFIHNIVDNFVFTVISAPFLWLLIMRPLQRIALSEKNRSDAVQAQVIDAVISVDGKGTIESFNPVAERIFGYSAAEAAGKDVSRLLCENRHCLNEMIRNAVGQHRENPSLLSGEVFLLCRDGAQLVMDVSVSRVTLGGRQSFLMIMRDITGRKEMEKALRESKERYDFAVNGANDGIWDWNIGTGEIYYSPRLRELLGYGEGEMGNTFSSFDSLLHPEDRDRALAEVQSHLKSRTPFDTEYRLRTKSGAYRWFNTRGRAVWDASGVAVRMAGSISDITGRKETETALNESLLRLRQIFEYTEDAIIFFKPGTCEVIDVNLSAERLYGYSREELLTIPFESLCSPGHFPVLKNSICNIRQGELSPLDNIINLRKDGTEIIVSMRGKVICLQGAETVYCTFRDVSERIRLEKEAREIQANLIQANKMTSLGLMVSGVAHEINNPINFIKANIQFMDQAWNDAIRILRMYQRQNEDFLIAGIPFSELEGQSPRLFAGILDGVKRINEIIQTLKRFARQELPSTDQYVEINETVRAAISILHHEIVNHTENFNMELGDDIPLVRGNSQQLAQVIINLLMNACQSLPSRQHGVWITTGYDREADEVKISVRDEGGGVPEGLRSRILEPFFTTKLDRGGTGLGLTISNSIIKDHNGVLEFTSEQGKGTVFTVRIPAAESMERSIYSEAS
jgi:PAS domain S-box-containing protein